MNSIHSIAPARLHALGIACLVSLTFLTAAPASAAPANETSLVANFPEQRYANATSLRNFTSALKAKILSNELKKAILDSARPEDKSFAQSIVVKWKAYTDKNIHTEFDELVVQGDNGKEILRLQPMPEKGVLLINGREWSAPEKGSIEKSLLSHLDKTSAQNDSAHSNSNKFDSLVSIVAPARAFAAGDSSQALTPAYIFATTLGDRRDGNYVSVVAPVDHATAIEIDAANLRQNENEVIGFFRSITSSPIEIVCRGSTASGTAEVGGVKTKFETQVDGKMLFQLADVAGTRLLITPKTKDFSSAASQGLREIAEFHRGGDKDKALAKKILEDFQALKQFDDAIFTETAKRANSNLAQMFAPSALINTEASISRFYTEHLRPVVTESMKVEQCVRKEDRWGIPVADTFGGKCEKTKPSQTREQTIYKWTKPKADPEETINEMRNSMLALRTLGSCCASAPCRRRAETQGFHVREESSSQGTQK